MRWLFFCPSNNSVRMANTALVGEKGLVVQQRGVAPDWAAHCHTKCQLPGPTTITGQHVVLKNQNIGPQGEVYTKRGLGLTDDISVRLDLESLCGPGTHWNARMKACVHDQIPSSMCGDGTEWDAHRSQCVRLQTCTHGYVYGGDVCNKPTTPAPATKSERLHVLPSNQ